MEFIGIIGFVGFRVYRVHSGHPPIAIFEPSLKSQYGSLPVSCAETTLSLSFQVEQRTLFLLTYSRVRQGPEPTKPNMFSWPRLEPPLESRCGDEEHVSGFMGIAG